MADHTTSHQPTGSTPSNQSSPPPASNKSAPAQHPPSSLGSSFWSSWISPSSSSAVAASSAFEKRSRLRRPTFEEFRAQEPPQARLIRLRGLFDTLLDEDDESALAGGRAREEWMKSARRARYGVGGSLARGALAPSDIRNSTVGFEDLRELKAASESNAEAGSSKDKLPPPPPRQSYAKELLAQCRKCREEVEQQRSKQIEALLQEKGKHREGWSWGVGGWLGGSKPDASASSEGSGPTSGATAALSKARSALGCDSATGAEDSQLGASEPLSPSSSLSSLSSLFGYGSSASCSANSSTEELSLTADLEQEAGWTGSGVWGLSAVGRKRREAEWRRDEQIRNGQEVEDDGGARQRQIEWEGFLAYAERKERELYTIFSELDKNGDMKLDIGEIRIALDRAGIQLPQLSLDDFIASLTCSRSSPCRPDEKPYVSFPEFRDYLLLLPRKPSVPEIFRFYQVRKAFGLFGMGGIFAELGAGWGKTERGASALNSDGDVSLAGEEKKKPSAAEKQAKRAEKRQDAAAAVTASSLQKGHAAPAHRSDELFPQQAAEVSEKAQAAAEAAANAAELDDDDDQDMIQGPVAIKFLLAGGIAGAVSRTATAPFDRLKIYLMTSSRASPAAEVAKQVAKGQTGVVGGTAKAAGHGIGTLQEALYKLYRDGGGVKAFWTGNGLNCVKIFPESAIKFLSYETSKRAFAKYVDHVSDSRDISGTSRFLSGGIGGITSQLAIYPIETLKTRLMSSQGARGETLRGNALLIKTAREMWAAGAARTYYRGLTAGLIGVFPYSAIDMSTFEGIKLFWIKYTGKEEPGVLALLSFGSISGSVGATTVYPLNLVRIRLQASGTPAHPTVYTGFMDAVAKTYANEGLVGFYRGLVPTLAKVVPAVSISYVVYEQSKKRLGVQ
ncbi:hypothetical protein ACQY0O_001563 [Thecaphora frezii]